MVTFASRIVIRVSFSTAWESLRAIKLKFYQTVSIFLLFRDGQPTRNVRFSFSVRQLSISDRQYSLMRSSSRSNRATAGGLSWTPTSASRVEKLKLSLVEWRVSPTSFSAKLCPIAIGRRFDRASSRSRRCLCSIRIMISS